MSVASPNRKFQFGASATVAIIAAATIFLMVNYLSSRHYWRWDWTSEGLYTLSGKTRQILDEEVTRKKASVTIDVLLSAGDSLSDSVRELLANYGAACPALAEQFFDRSQSYAAAGDR